MLNSISKILEKIVSKRLVEHFENNNIFSNNQFAYRSGRGTDLALCQFTDHILKKFDEGETTLAIFLDLTRAFDCVNPKILIPKFNPYCENGNAIIEFID